MLVTDASGWVTPEVHLSVPAGFVRLVPRRRPVHSSATTPRSPHTAPKLREAWDAAVGSSRKPPYKDPHPSPRVIDTLGQQIAEKHWKMSNSGLAYSEQESY